MKNLFSCKKVILIAVILLGLGSLLLLFKQPSHDREWELGQEQLPRFNIYGDVLRVENYRNFRWTGEFTAEPRYETRQFDLTKLVDLDVFISHFDPFEGLAHIFLSFGFAGGDRLVVSLESRREVGETFSPFLGLFRHYEIIYVVGSEADLVGARTAWRGERVYRYPTVATPEQARALLLKLGEDVSSVYAEPRFYNTLTNNCTNAVTRRVEEMSAVKFPFTWKTLMPGYFDEVLYEMGLIRTTGSFSETKQARLINQSPDPTQPYFSQKLRGAILPQEDVVPAKPAPEATTDWKSYTNEGIGLVLRYDPTLTVSEDESKQVRFYKWGPTQKGQTEMYDGIVVSFRQVAFDGTFDQYIEKGMTEFQDAGLGTITRPLTPYELDGRAGQTYSISSLGDFKLIFIPTGDQELLEVSILTPDPTGAGFEQLADRLLSTVKIVP